MSFPRLLACVAVVVAGLLAFPSAASARSLGFAYDEGHVIGAVAGAPPSHAHPWGTLLLSWCEQRGEASSVYLGEWSLRDGGWLRRRVVRSPALCPLVIHLARSSDRTFMVTGAVSGDVELVSFDDFVEQGSAQLPEGDAPSLDADDRHVVVSTFESQTPVLVPRPDSPVAAPAHGLHVRVFDPSTLAIVSGRMFRGDHLLRPHRVPAIAGRALRLLGSRLYVQVADDDPHVVAVRLPSLATEIDRAFVVPPGRVTPFSSSVALERVGSSLVIGADATYVLSPALDVLVKRAHVATEPLPLVAHGRRVSLGPPGPRASTWEIRVLDRPHSIRAH